MLLFWLLNAVAEGGLIVSVRAIERDRPLNLSEATRAGLPIGSVRRSRVPRSLDCSMAKDEAPEVLEGLSFGAEQTRIQTLPSAETPSLSVLAAVEALDGPLPLLITTADHPLLQPALVERFCREAEAGGADIAASLAPASVIRTAFPESRRTYLLLSMLQPHPESDLGSDGP